MSDFVTRENLHADNSSIIDPGIGENEQSKFMNEEDIKLMSKDFRSSNVGFKVSQPRLSYNPQKPNTQDNVKHD